MKGQNLKPLLVTAAKEYTKHNATNSNLSFTIRKRLIWIANQMKSDAHQLNHSNEILLRFRTEIDKLRIVVKSGGDL
jgi:hypothetical protein